MELVDAVPKKCTSFHESQGILFERESYYRAHTLNDGIVMGLEASAMALVIHSLSHTHLSSLVWILD